MIRRFYVIILLAALCYSALEAQFRSTGLNGGIGYGGVFGKTELTSKLRAEARGFLRYGFVDQLQAELGLGFGRIGGDEFTTFIMPIDFRLVWSPLNFDGWNPYLYAGYGTMKYKLDDQPVHTSPGAKIDDWTGFAPVGVGLQFVLTDKTLVELTGGYNFTSSDDLDATREATKKDGFWNVLLNVTLMGYNGKGDPDHDGLTNDQEKQLGTDPKNSDTDGDGLTDGEEVNAYRTDPLKKDSDGDGLSDYDEVKKYSTDPNKKDTDGDGLSDGDELLKYHTDPLKADTDGDGLSDGEELLKYHTDPLKTDTDGDGLSDGDEVQKYHTDPLNTDTDGDGLFDGDEVLKYHTDPLKRDTDDGGIDDATEIKNGTDPLNPADDHSKDVLKVEKGASLVLEGIEFKSGSAEILPESQPTLEKVYNTMKGTPDLEVEIQGYTDNTGRRAANIKLSKQRADAVKAFLVGKGVEEKRIATKGLGPDKPIAPNTTPEGKQKNRRIEFFRTK